jgi:collagenase-like PrtC family protease
VPIRLDAPLAAYLEAGVKYLKLGGRDRPEAEVAEEIRAVREMLGELESTETHAFSSNSRS